MSLASETGRGLGAQPLPVVRAKPSPAPWATPERRVVLCALATSALLYLCYFPVGWGFLGWVALVPLLGLVRSTARSRRIYWSAYLCGVAFYLPVIQWMRVADPRMYFTWLALAIYIAVYFPLAIFLVRKLDRRTGLPLALTLPVVWTALEFVRSLVLGGFPWYMLGYSQHRFNTLIQVADITGVYGVSFLVLVVNALVFEWLYRLAAVRRVVGRAGEPAPTRRPALAFQSAVALLAIAGCLAYGSWRIGQADFRSGPRLALIQGNLPQQLRNDSSDTAREIIETSSNMLSELAARRSLPDARRPHLVVWPETSYPEWDEVVTDRPVWRLDAKLQELIRFSREDAARVAREHRAYVLLGVNYNENRVDEGVIRRYNSALLIGPGGRILGRYDKMHRVPFGEFVPFRETFPFMNRFAPYDFDYSVLAGEQQTRLALGPYRFGVVICYEDTDPCLAREYVNPTQGEKADFLINISNDGWFDGTSEHEEHLAICRFRAIESRRAIARSVNMGVSAVIDGNGRVLAPELVGREEGALLWELDAGTTAELPVGRWKEFKKVPGVLFATIPLDDRGSLYAHWGDWLPLACWVMLGTTLLYLFIHRRRPSRATGGLAAV